MNAKFLFFFVAAAAAVWFVPRFPVQSAQANDRAFADVAARIRPLGLSVVGDPARQGEVYMVNALDQRGTEMRVILDARTGNVVSIGPSPAATSYAYSPYSDASPRIITIAPSDDDEDDFAAPSRRQSAARASVRSKERNAIEPRQEVRQIVPPRERPQEFHQRTASVAPDMQVSSPRAARPALPAKQHVSKPEPKFESKLERRAMIAPAASPFAPSSPQTYAPQPSAPQAALPPAIPPAAVTAPASAEPRGPRWRPRTVLAPPPYADPQMDQKADHGPSPVRPLHHRDSSRFAPPAAPVEPAIAPPPADPLRDETRAAVPQSLPQIPAPMRAAGMPAAMPEAAPTAEVASKPDVPVATVVPAEVKTAPVVLPEDLPPPGDPVGDFVSPQ